MGLAAHLCGLRCAQVSRPGGGRLPLPAAPFVPTARVPLGAGMTSKVCAGRMRVWCERVSSYLLALLGAHDPLLLRPAGARRL